MTSRISPWRYKDTGRRSNARRKPATSSSFQMFAIKKLKDHPDYQDCGGNEAAETARDLTDRECITNRFFSAISTGLAEIRIDEKIEEGNTELVTSAERKAAEERSTWRVEDTAKFEVKLLLRHIATPMAGLMRTGAKLLKLWYGPLHSALLINDTIFLEWNTSSFVIPEEYDENLNYPIVTSVLHQESQIAAPKDIRTDEIDLIFTATEKKQEILNALVRVIARYNGQFIYNAIRKNCQHFVTEALEEMGCKNVPKFEGELKEYYKKLEAGRAGTDFEDNHGNLDKYVADNILVEENQKLSTQHKEYLLSQYFEFHIKEMTSSPNPEEWTCSFGASCMLAELENCIDQEAMLMHKFIRD